MTKENHITVEIYRGRTNVDEHNEPAETVDVPLDENVVWKDDPWYSSPPLGFAIAEEDRPATLYVYTNDSVRVPHKADVSAWGRPIERGLPFPADAEDRRPFGCEVWGRVMFSVEEGLTR